MELSVKEINAKNVLSFYIAACKGELRSSDTERLTIDCELNEKYLPLRVLDKHNSFKAWNFSQYDYCPELIFDTPPSGLFGDIVCYDLGSIKVVVKLISYDAPDIAAQKYDSNDPHRFYDLTKFQEHVHYERDVMKKCMENSSHTMPIYGYFELVDKDALTARYAIIMPYLQVVNDEIFKSETETMEMLRQIAMGLQCLHQTAKALHRDLKLQNYFFYDLPQEKRNYVLGDFGIAKPIEFFENKGNKTLPYVPMASIVIDIPEYRDMSLTPSTDVWLLCASLKVQMKRSIYHTSDFSKNFTSIIETATQKEPSERFQDTADFLAAVEMYFATKKTKVKSGNVHFKGDERQNSFGLLEEPLVKRDENSSHEDSPKLMEDVYYNDNSFIAADQWAEKCIESILQLVSENKKLNQTNVKSAIDYAEKGVKAGSARCKRLLAFIYLRIADNENDKSTYQKAYQLLEDETDDKAAFMKAFIAYFEKSKPEIAIAQLYKKTASSGYAPAQYMYGEVCLNGIMGVPVDKVSAAHYLRYAYENGFLEALNDLRVVLVSINIHDKNFIKNNPEYAGYLQYSDEKIEGRDNLAIYSLLKTL